MVTVLPAVLLVLAAATAADDPTSLAAEALAANPGIAAQQAQVRALQATADVAAAWPDPVVALEYSNVPVTTWDLAGSPMAGVQLRAQQTLPFPGVPGLRAEVADARVAVAAARLEEARLQLVRAVQETWWHLALTRRLRAVTADHLALTAELLEAVRASYETGAAGQSAMLRLQVQRDGLQDALGDFERQERQLEAALAAALHRPPGSQFSTPDALVPAPLSGDAGAWLAQAEARHPALRQQDAAIQAAEAGARLAHRDALPDLTVWAGYRLRAASDMDPGADLASLGLSVPLPAGGARAARGQEDAALAGAEAARQQRQVLVDALAADLTAAEAAWRRASDKAEAYAQDLLPATRAALDSTLADFRVGRADFSSLYQAEVQLLDLQRALLTATAETHLQEVAVQALTGTQPAIPGAGS